MGVAFGAVIWGEGANATSDGGGKRFPCVAR